MLILALACSTLSQMRNLDEITSTKLCYKYTVHFDLLCLTLFLPASSGGRTVATSRIVAVCRTQNTMHDQRALSKVLVGDIPVSVALNTTAILFSLHTLEP